MASATINGLSWGSSLWLAKIALILLAYWRFWLAYINFWLLRAYPSLTAQAYSALSSSLYTIAATAGAQWTKMTGPNWHQPWFLVPLFPIRMFAWGALGGWCWWRMLPVSTRVVETIGYDAMDGSQCDIRQTILRRRGYYVEAVRCCVVGLGKFGIADHTSGLLLIGFVESKLAYPAEVEIDKDPLLGLLRKAVSYAARVESGDPRQASRIYRHASNLALRLGSESEAVGWRAKAAELARQTGAGDQLLKLEASRG